MILAFLLVILAGLFMGWNIGANDAANCVGVDIGSGKMTVKQGIIITCVFSLLGALLLGSHVIKTVGKGIVPLDKLEHNVAVYITLAAAFGAGIWVMLATYFKLPVSTSHAIVGAVGGAGLACNTLIIWKKLLDIFICWVITPFGSALLAFLMYYPVLFLFSLLVPKKYEDKVVAFLIFVTSAYLAFAWGANDVANATGIMVGSKMVTKNIAVLIGASAIIIGIVTWGRKVIETVGFNITHLTPLMAIVAEVASALNVTIYTLLGIPVSTSHSIVGAVFGIGLVKGIKSIDIGIIRGIVFAWVCTPFTAGAVAFLLMKGFILLKLI
ncbi:MAG: inorganic phosphate transporter [Candidatus Omnitrophota bacterium]